MDRALSAAFAFTRKHPGIADCDRIDENKINVAGAEGEEVRKIIENMRDKEMCVLDRKPETEFGVFWLKKPNKLKLDLQPWPWKKARKPKIVKQSIEPSSNYIGMWIWMLKSC